MGESMNASVLQEWPISIMKRATRLGRMIPFVGRRLQRGRNDVRRLLLAHMPKHSVCAEIGVWKGAFTDQILTMVEPTRLHLIDPWQFDGSAANQWFGGRSGHAKAQPDMEQMYRSIIDRFGSLPNVAVHRATSSQIAPTLPDDYFDWIYVDGNHSFGYVLADLWDYLPKVKRGGFLAGDDYWWGPEEQLPVKRAVQTLLDAGRAELRFLQRGQFILKKV